MCVCVLVLLLFSYQGLSLPRSIKIVICDFCPFLVKQVVRRVLSGRGTRRDGSWDHRCPQYTGKKEEISN